MLKPDYKERRKFLVSALEFVQLRYILEVLFLFQLNRTFLEDNYGISGSYIQYSMNFWPGGKRDNKQPNSDLFSLYMVGHFREFEWKLYFRVWLEKNLEKNQNDSFSSRVWFQGYSQWRYQTFSSCHN